MDPLDRLHEYLSGIVPADILTGCITAVRHELGGGAVYVHSPIRERIQSIQSALVAGVSCKAIAAAHGVTTQAVRYHRQKRMG